MENITERYTIFKAGFLPNNKSMDKRNVIFIVDTSDRVDKALAVQDLTETLHIPVISPDVISGGQKIPNEEYVRTLERFLSQMVPHGFILGNQISSKSELAVFSNWSRTNNFPVFRISIGDCNYPDEIEQLIEDTVDCSIKISDEKSDQDRTRQMFNFVSERCFEDPGLAQDFFQFNDITRKLGIDTVLVSGACSYIYWGRRALKDLDILVPSKRDLENIGESVGEKPEHLVSSFADTQYLNFSHGVEAVSDLVVLNSESGKEYRIPFDFDEVFKDARKVRFMGEECSLMSPEMVILFKFALGRFGIDKWNQQKDDYEDARGVFVSQPIDLKSMRDRARKIGALERFELGLKILQIKE